MSVLCPQCGAPAAEGAAKCEYCGAAIGQPVAQPQAQPQYNQQSYNPVNPAAANLPEKSKIVAGILALLLGGLGIHKFYLGQIGKGILYLILCWTYVPGIIAFVEGIIILTSSDEKFQQKYKCRIKS